MGACGWPRITIVTPSFNQGRFLEETIRSVLLQGYPNLEYIVMDGGSRDNSLDIIKKYAQWLTYWASEPDGGQSAAINRGLNLGTGLFAGWINSDDLLCPNALVQHASQVGFEPNTVYVGYCVYVDQDSRSVSLHRGTVRSLEDLVRIKKVWRAEAYKGHIDQPAVLFPRGLAVAIGGLNGDNHYTMDYEFWGELFLAGARFQYTDISFGMFREHSGQKTHEVLRQTRSLLETAHKLIVRAPRLSEETKRVILRDLNAYSLDYQKAHWKGTGRLANLFLPQFIVTPLRNLKTFLQRT
jgi:glycosyltransferase involved in cell wall biosynthesis